MGGDAGVESEPGEGSTFWFTVRLKKSEHEEVAAAASSETEAVTQLRERFSGTRILLVEDNEINQMVAQAILEDAGLVCDVAGDGEEAVTTMRSAKPGTYALALMDMQMPKMDGVTATRAIRQLDAGRKMPIVAMTANAFSEDVERCLAAGMNDFVAKPVDPDSLYSTLLKWLAGGSASGETT
jgi:CheY-like chemotaxis protein